MALVAEPKAEARGRGPESSRRSSLTSSQAEVPSERSQTKQGLNGKDEAFRQIPEISKTQKDELGFRSTHPQTPGLPRKAGKLAGLWVPGLLARQLWGSSGSALHL
ncbi:hypothetical protein Cadr_000019977 [Camelus dromedarius]|uniref:Uncharacterized protein n=1 Tax=Camelus dromedarius TaxID=9838 RepID=A0A5N4D290_CAMDR|nr:hypothetical protein Cadr_000019977 [Camelus dromedarius]